ncbi:LysR family transcriptional regulator [Lutimaribacter sp. EGI FJ00015]|uniref:LysR family transcriptional regulator n=1 Tax=Lutimaribacter degradans TaxID=2945989 RepID=A0ACC5ZZW9_9RHOB|nr:LysR family transcriptional regulator [Lutimaribacter sp. EGI FJ00013]MCM2563918.1 LysR family transcriptional regulator [Lutimaribacter sp. EGI FJ00013]MCO0615119.1 LysR family transcriptional regulator [Lutimaribacter sp. EGI FJ00015]MCO0637747.1 LysR family transcriptional regulator [Lutimaribacter sp. EGI FJ00014]
MRALTAVAEEGSFSAAARRIGISHSAVAQQVRDLERAYDIHLFDRVRGVLRATPACLELCDIGNRMQDAMHDAERVLARRGPTGKHRLRVGLGNSMPGIAIVGRVLSLHPTLTVSVESGSHQDIMAAVSRREVDVAVLPDLPADTRFRRAPVISQEVVAIVSPDSPMADQGEVSLERLAASPLVFRSHGSSTQKIVDRGFRQAGLAPEPRLTADTRDAVYEAVALGIGVGFMWRYGTYRSDTVRRIPVPEFHSTVDEVVFALADERNALIDLFFNVAAQLSPKMLRT